MKPFVHSNYWILPGVVMLHLARDTGHLLAENGAGQGGGRGCLGFKKSKILKYLETDGESKETPGDLK